MARGRVLELAAVVFGGAFQHLAQRGLVRACLQCALLFGRVRRVVGHGHADLLRQVGHGIAEAHAGMLHQEADGVAMRAAAEAVIELLGRVDAEARRFFAVEGAQPHVVGAAALELDVAADDLDDVDARQQVLQEAGWDHRGSLGAQLPAARDPLAAGAAASANRPR
jgi:hypothetical protein